MKKALLLFPFLAFLLCGCPNNKSNNEASQSINDGTIIVDLNLSNYERYIKCTRYEGFTGPSRFSPYEAWFEFEGLLSIGIYDVTVTYMVGSTSYNFKLDVSGGGKTDTFDRMATCKISQVSGTVSYRL